MKETGIIRRIDDLGRIVIPKEIRDRLGIENGDALDVFTENNSIILQKYQHIDNNTLPIKAIFSAIQKNYGGDYFYINKNEIVYSTIDLELNPKLNIADYLDIEISNNLFMFNAKSFYIKELGNGTYVGVIDNIINKEKKDLVMIIYTYLLEYYKIN